MLWACASDTGKRSTTARPTLRNPRTYIALQLAALTTLAALEDRVTTKRDERGSVTIEQVLWAGAVIVIVGIVVAAIKFFVTSESAKIK